MRNEIDRPATDSMEDDSEERTVQVEGFLLVVLGISFAMCLSIVASSDSKVVGLVCGFVIAAILVLLGLGIRPPKRQSRTRD
jgi:cobalamin biosynthesis protein CobD/CbiB